MDSELVAQRSSHPAFRSQRLDANTIGIFIPILQTGPITHCIIISHKQSSSRGSWRQSSWKTVLFDMCHCQNLWEVSGKPTHSLSIMRLFGLTDRSYEALAVNFGLKYHQWILTTHLLWSALLSLANSFTEPNIYLPLISKWNRNLDAISECIWKAKADWLGQLLEIHQ